MKSEYWLAKPDPKDVACHLTSDDSASAVLSSNPISQAWVRNSVSYFSPVLEPNSWETSLIPMGSQGELVRMVVPLARQFVRQVIGVITKQKMSFNALAEKCDSDVTQAMRLADSLCRQIVDEQNVEAKWDSTLEQMFVNGAGFMGATFETDKGFPYDVKDNTLLYSGKPVISNPTVWDTLYDYNICDWEDLDWLRVRRKRNRYVLMAQFPDMVQEIAALPSIREEGGAYRYIFRLPSEEDYVYCYELYAKESPALPNGRMLFYSNDKTIYFDGPNIYRCIPFEPAMSEKIQGTGFGYPLYSNLMPAQEMFDITLSTIATNQSSFGVQNVTVPRGAGISVQEILGMNFMSYTAMPGVSGGGKPEALNLTQTPNEIFKSVEILQGLLENMSGVNSALRGDPPPGVTAGTAIATLTSTAIENINSGAKSAKRCLEKVLMHAINAERKFSNPEVPNIVSYSGPNNEMVSKEYIGTDLDPIKHVKLTETNPLMQTLSGRLEIASQILQNNPANIKAYYSVLEGEPPKELYDKELSAEDLMKRENESLSLGKPVKALSLDDHPTHISYHSKLLNDPEIRLKSDKVEAITDHIMDHLNLAKNTDPALLAMVETGRMPQGGLQSNNGPSGPPPGPGGGPPPPGGPQGPVPPDQGDNLPTAKPAHPAKDLLGRS